MKVKILPKKFEPVLIELGSRDTLNVMINLLKYGPGRDFSCNFDRERIDTLLLELTDIRNSYKEGSVDG